MTAIIFNALKIVGTLVQLLIASLRPRAALAAANLFLRHQLALYRERIVKARRPDQVVRFTLAYLSRLFDRRNALIIVQPRTLIAWHRAGFRLFWKWESRSGCPPIPIELRKLIKELAKDNPLWGEERIANELLLKLSVRLSLRTVRKYMPKLTSGVPRGDQRWAYAITPKKLALVTSWLR